MENIFFRKPTIKPAKSVNHEKTTQQYTEIKNNLKHQIYLLNDKIVAFYQKYHTNQSAFKINMLKNCMNHIIQFIHYYYDDKTTKSIDYFSKLKENGIQQIIKNLQTHPINPENKSEYLPFINQLQQINQDCIRQELYIKQIEDQKYKLNKSSELLYHRDFE